MACNDKTQKVFNQAFYKRKCFIHLHLTVEALYASYQQKISSCPPKGKKKSRIIITS